MKKLKKWQLATLIIIPVAIVLGAVLLLFLNNQNANQEAIDSKPLVQKAKEGSALWLPQFFYQDKYPQIMSNISILTLLKEI